MQSKMEARMEDPNQGRAGPSEWTTGLFDCSEDLGNCCYTFWYTCIPYGQMMEILDSGNTTCFSNGFKYTVAVLVCMPCALSCSLRKNLRAKYNLPEGHGDFCTHFWCEFCALCQEYREMENRGLNPELGWAQYAKQASGSTQMSAMPEEQDVF